MMFQQIQWEKTGKDHDEWLPFKSERLQRLGVHVKKKAVEAAAPTSASPPSYDDWVEARSKDQTSLSYDEWSKVPEVRIFRDWWC